MRKAFLAEGLPRRAMCLSGAPAVDAVVTAAASATAAASTKAARRRVRQRMVKKLAPMIGKEELQELVDNFKMQPTPAQVGEQPPVTQPAQASATLPMPMQFVYVPLAIPMVMVPPRAETQLVSVCAFQDVCQLPEKPRVQCVDATADLGFGDGSASAHVSSNCPIFVESIPVARTFVHFDTCEGSFVQRSLSV